MNATAIDYCETCNNPLISKGGFVKFIYIMIYLCIYIINYRRINAYFDAKVEKLREIELDREEEEVLGLIRPEEDEVQDEVEEEDMETLNIYDFEGTGEQLRRLRAYNLKNDGETDEEYEKRIWDMAYEEDEEKEMRKNEGKKIEKREKREKRETKKRKRE